MPIVFARAGGALWSPVDGKPKRGGELARIRHVARDSRVSLLIDAWHADWAALWWLRLEGRASVTREEASGFAAAAHALRAKYPQYAQVPLFRGAPTLLRIEIARCRSWCASEAAVRGVLSLGGAR